MNVTIKRMIDNSRNDTSLESDGRSPATDALLATDGMHATSSLVARDDLLAVRRCQVNWAERPLSERVAWAKRLAGIMATRADALVASIVRPAARNDGELLASEVLPLAEACRYMAKRGASVLKPQRLARRDAAWWMGSISVDQQRVPWGVVLVIGPSNYPLLLPGVQLMQAVVAGNAVLVKPAPACARAMEVLKELCVLAGMPPDLVQVLDTQPSAAEHAIRAGVDKVVFTGSYTTGQAVARQLVETMTPAAMELSGNDAVLLLDSADMPTAAKAIAYALDMNGGQTCIAPRRLFATPQAAAQLMPLLTKELEGRAARTIQPRGAQAARGAVDSAVTAGARYAFGSAEHLDDSQAVRPVVLSGVTAQMQIAREDLFAPILSLIQVQRIEEAVPLANSCRYALGACVFGEPHEAWSIAARIEAGCITINDCLVPTADPRVSFGGWRSSGYGVTRGLEGLRELTQLKVTCQRRGRWLPHLSTGDKQLAAMMRGILLFRHGAGLRERWAGIKFMISAGRK